MEKVSIIVPVYNVEKYVEECINSILCQTYNNIELILIDDGSKDLSFEKCKNYQNLKNVFLYHIENSGASKARNFGIEKASGKYLMFVDSDDVIEKEMVQNLVECIESKNVDMVVCSYLYQYKDRVENVFFSKDGYLSQIDAKIEMFKTDSIQGFSVNKIYKRNIIIENKIEFDEKIKICEDMLFVFNYINYIKDAYIINKPYYHYRMRKSSASNNAENDLTVFITLNKIDEIDKNAKKYYYGLYCYLFFKYYKYIKKDDNFEKISLISSLLDKKIETSRKKGIIINLFVPSFLKNIIKNIKQKKSMYFD